MIGQKRNARIQRRKMVECKDHQAEQVIVVSYDRDKYQTSTIGQHGESTVMEAHLSPVFESQEAWGSSPEGSRW